MQFIYHCLIFTLEGTNGFIIDYASNYELYRLWKLLIVVNVAFNPGAVCLPRGDKCPSILTMSLTFK